ncbi:MAG: TraB/GumN family protein [Candidatus Sericytochromatia bacterium]
MANRFRLSRWLLAGLVATLPLAAPSPWMPQAQAKAPNEYHLFVWKVTAPGAASDAQPDYMIGTMHLPVDAGLVMPAPVRNLIAEASAVVTEADTSQVNATMLGKYIRLRGDKSLKQLLPPASWSQLVKLKPMGLPPEHLARIEPWYVNLVLTMPTPDGRPVIDDLVQQEAKQARVPVTHLEKAEQQLQFMDSIKQDEDVKQLIATLKEPQKAKAQLDDLRKSYFAGDGRRVEAMVFEPEALKLYPDYFNKLLFDRNARWMPQVDKLFKGEDAVVAVGLGHMLGDKGLIKLLKAKGYTVEPLAL